MKKTLLAFLVVALAAISAQAQIFRPSVVQGAVLGGAAGAVIGHNSGRHAGEGAAIGAVAGALLGAAFDRGEPQRTVVYSQQPQVIYQEPQVVYAPQPVYCPPPVTTQIVYVQTAPVYATPVYCPPAPRVVVYGHRPAPVVVYQNYGYSNCGWGAPVVYGHVGRSYGGGRWR